MDIFDLLSDITLTPQVPVIPTPALPEQWSPMRPNELLKDRRILSSISFDHLTPKPLLESTQDPADLPIMWHNDQVHMIRHDHIRDDIEP
jgi:hypothetical protein